MKRIKLALAITALAVSTNAAAMPEQVSDGWYDNMMFRLGVMSGNPGFCRAHPQAWVCF
jgi:hypothetical protein